MMKILILSILLLAFCSCTTHRFEDITNSEEFRQVKGKTYLLKKDCFVLESWTKEIPEFEINNLTKLMPVGRLGFPNELNRDLIGTKVKGQKIVGFLNKGTEIFVQRCFFKHGAKIGEFVIIIKTQKHIYNGKRLFQLSWTLITPLEQFIELKEM